MNTNALAVAVGVLSELGIAWPVPLVLDYPALTHQSQQCFWAGATDGISPGHVITSGRSSTHPQLQRPHQSFPLQHGKDADAPLEHQGFGRMERRIRPDAHRLVRH